VDLLLARVALDRVESSSFEGVRRFHCILPLHHFLLLLKTPSVRFPAKRAFRLSILGGIENFVEFVMFLKRIH
jgi:hypothetical protein